MRRRRLAGHEADDLHLFIDNERDLWKWKQAVQTNLTKHVCRGVFDKTQARKGFARITAEAGKRYAKERGAPGWRYPKVWRDEADQDLVQEYLARLRMCRVQGHCGDLPAEAVAILRKKACKPGPASHLSGPKRRRRG